MKLIIGKNGLIAKKMVEKSADSCTLTSSKNDSGVIFLNLSRPSDFNFSLINENTFIVFLAAVSSPDECKNDFERAYGINVAGTKHFIKKAFEKRAKVLFFSSDVIYGNSIESVNEESPVNPFGEYAGMKDEVEKAFEGEKNFKVFRLSYVLSKEDKYLKYLQHCIIENKVAEVFHPFSRKMVFIDDVLDAIEAILNSWDEFHNQKFNICGTENISRRDIADYYNEAVNNRLKYKLIEPDEAFWEARPKDINITSLYLEKLLGRQPIKISEAIEKIIKGDI